MHKYIHNVTKVMCALYVRCALSVLQKECRIVWGARYTLGARYRSENTVLLSNELSSGGTCPSFLLVIKTDSVAETLCLKELKTINNVQNCIYVVLISGTPLPSY